MAQSFCEAKLKVPNPIRDPIFGQTTDAFHASRVSAQRKLQVPKPIRDTQTEPMRALNSSISVSTGSAIARMLDQ